MAPRKKFYEFWKKTWARIAERYANTPRDELTLSSDFLFELYKDSELDNKELEALIAITINSF